MGTTKGHDAPAEVSRLEAKLGDANREIGGLSMELKLARHELGRVKAEVARLRAAMLAQVALLETLPASADAETIRRAIDIAVERFDAALYPKTEAA